MKHLSPGLARRIVCVFFAALFPLGTALPAFGAAEQQSEVPAFSSVPEATVSPAAPTPAAEETAESGPAASPASSASPAATASPASSDGLRENSWVVPLSISGWEAGKTPHLPQAQPRYGTVVFYYGKAGETLTTTAPETAGTWICRAYVAAGATYTSLSAQTAFTVTPAVQSQPAIPDDLTGTYRSSLRDIPLPAGFSWSRPSSPLSADVGIHKYPAVYTPASGSPETVQIPVRITPAPAAKCSISAITNEYQANHIVITMGTYTLKKGTDYTVSSRVQDGTVTLTIDFTGNFTGQEVRTFAYMETNSWIVPLSIANWTEGETPSSPRAAARYGTVVFTYYKDGVLLSGRPASAGTYVVRAEVPASDYYTALGQEVTFTVYPAQASVPIPQDLSGVYRRPLGNVALPAGFAWASPGSVLTADVGIHTYAATYTPDGAASAIAVEIPVKIEPAPGTRCTISPVTDEAQARNIRITDGTYRLKKGVDYTVSSDVSGKTVTVTIDFIGNYYGTVTRTFTFQLTNEWVVPLSMQSWTEGQPAGTPEAEAKYGTPAYTYYEDGHLLSGKPSAPGTYTVKAVVAASIYYPEISAEATFTIYPQEPDNIPLPEGLSAVYRTELGDIRLPEGFTWEDPGLLITQDVGEHSYSAAYTNSGGESVRVSIPLTVKPAPGSRCTISPIENEDEASHIVITDGSYTLVKNVDYTISDRVAENLVTITITFIGNYTGKAERTFIYSDPNEWTEPLTIDDWCAGDIPAEPHAAAKFGTPVYSYLVDGVYRSYPPTAPGTYTVRAVVAASAYYDSLEAQVRFRIYAAAAPEVGQLSATYGQKLRDVALPEGFTWESPDAYVGNVGLRAFPASYPRTEEYFGGTVHVSVQVSPRDGALCTISPITNEYQGRHIVITDEGVTLRKGTDYTVSSSVEGNVVTVIIDFCGNYCGRVIRTFTFEQENAWVVKPAISSWVRGESGAVPVGEAKYGITQFTYLVDGAYQKEQPTKAGSYRMRAAVEATSDYKGLTAEVAFSIYDAVAPATGVLEAVYGQKLSDITLPGGFSWDNPNDYVGNVGTHDFPANYAAGRRDITYMGGEVEIEVRVAPRNGALCTVSPIEDEYEARHIIITDHGRVLVKGTDYTVSSSVSGNTVTVTIDFEGNYYGTVTRSFTLQYENAWVVPLSIESWIYGQTPSSPQAEAKYGTPVFSYVVDGKAQTAPPVNAGKYTLRAEVPASEYYAALNAAVPFEILPAAAPAPSEDLSAVYGDRLSDITLPEDYTWQTPAQYVGNVGPHVFTAEYTAPADSNYRSGPVNASVQVTPRNGVTSCTISAITNDYEAAHVVITDHGQVLKDGTDYTIRMMHTGRNVTVQITFVGNYYGSTTRRFTLEEENYWVIPLTIASWTEGETPASPIAEARYGSVVFTYAASDDSVTDSTEKPTKPGSYIVRARVAPTAQYNGLYASQTFQIFTDTGSSAEPTSEPISSLRPAPTAPTSAVPSDDVTPSAPSASPPSAGTTASAEPSADVSVSAVPTDTAAPTKEPAATPSPGPSPVVSAEPTMVPTASGPAASATPDSETPPGGSSSLRPAPSPTPNTGASSRPSDVPGPSADTPGFSPPSATLLPSPAPESPSPGPTVPGPSSSAMQTSPTPSPSPGDAAAPVTSDAPGSPGPFANAGPSSSGAAAETVPKTEDRTNVCGWWTVLLGSGTFLFLGTRYLKRKKER